MNLILFGPMGAGKTTIAEILVKQYGYVRFSLGKKIHEDCAYWGNESRTQMQKYGQSMREIVGEDIWNQYLYNRLNNHIERLLEQERVVIDDGRQLNEFKYWGDKNFKRIGVKTDDDLRIKRLTERTGKEPTIEQLNHETEKQSKICAVDAIIQINNNGTIEDLNDGIRHLITVLEVKKI